MEALLQSSVPLAAQFRQLSSGNLAVDVPRLIAGLSAPAHSLLPTIPLRLALHGLRVAVAWRQIVRARGTERDVRGLRGLFGFLVLALGGSTISQILLSAPLSWLSNSAVLPTFAVIYYASTPLLSLLLPWTPTFLVDVGSAGLDAVNRSIGAMGVVALLAAHTEVSLRTSWVGAALLGGIACAGGGILCDLLGLWDKDWRLQTPAILKSSPSIGAYALMTLNFWSGAVIAVVYGTALDLPAFGPLRSFLLANFSRPASPWAALTQLLGVGTKRATTVEEAQTACTVLLFTLLLGRVVIVWVAAQSSAFVADKPKSASHGGKAGSSTQTLAPEKFSTPLTASQKTPVTPSSKAKRRKGKGSS